jgi:hypothetical protein
MDTLLPYILAIILFGAPLLGYYLDYKDRPALFKSELKDILIAGRKRIFGLLITTACLIGATLLYEFGRFLIHNWTVFKK